MGGLSRRVVGAGGAGEGFRGLAAGTRSTRNGGGTLPVRPGVAGPGELLAEGEDVAAVGVAVGEPVHRLAEQQDAEAADRALVRADGWWGEGEVKFFLDGDRGGATICGTGTEDYFLGAWGFDDGGYREYCTPWSGLAHIRRPDGLYKAVPRFSLYRWHLPDPIRFREDIRVTVQDLGWRSGGRYLSRNDDISTVAYWYQSEPFTDFPPFPSRAALEIV